jgi:hypothetical protein
MIEGIFSSSLKTEFVPFMPFNLLFGFLLGCKRSCCRKEMPFILQSLQAFWPVIHTVSGRLFIRYYSERRTIVFHSPKMLEGTITSVVIRSQPGADPQSHTPRRTAYTLSCSSLASPLALTAQMPAGRGQHPSGRCGAHLTTTLTRIHRRELSPKEARSIAYPLLHYHGS